MLTVVAFVVTAGVVSAGVVSALSPIVNVMPVVSGNASAKSTPPRCKSITQRASIKSIVYSPSAKSVGNSTSNSQTASPSPGLMYPIVSSVMYLKIGYAPGW